LACTLFFFWGSGLGTSELDKGEYCVNKSSQILMGHGEGVDVIATVSSDSPKILSGSCDTTIKVWSLNDGKNVLTFTDHINRINKIALTKCKKVVSGSVDGSIYVWDVESGERLLDITHHRSPILAILVCDDEISHYTGCVVSCSDDGLVCVWDMQTGSLVSTDSFMALAQRGNVWSVATAAILRDDSLVVAFGGLCGSVYVWDAYTKQSTCLCGHFASISAVYVYDKVGEPMVISASADWMVRVWDLKTGKSLRSLEGHSASVDAVTVLHGSTPLVISGSTDATVRVWDLYTGEQYYTLEGHTSGVCTLAIINTRGFSNDNSALPLIISGGADSAIRVWDLDKILRDIKWKRRKFLAVFVSNVRELQYKESLIQNNLNACGKAAKELEQRRNYSLVRSSYVKAFVDSLPAFLQTSVSPFLEAHTGRNQSSLDNYYALRKVSACGSFTVFDKAEDEPSGDYFAYSHRRRRVHLLTAVFGNNDLRSVIASYL
jgi:WD40 repeat protein